MSSEVTIAASIAALAIAAFALLLSLGVSARLRELDRELESWRAPMRLGGLAAGANVPDVDVRDVAGEIVDWAHAAAGPTLVAFVSPGCSPCEGVRDALPAFGASHRSWQMLVVSDGLPDAAIAKFGAVEETAGARLVLDENRAIAQKFENIGTPHGFVLHDGTVAASGMLGDIDTLERLARSIDASSADERVGRSLDEGDVTVAASRTN